MKVNNLHTHPNVLVHLDDDTLELKRFARELQQSAVAFTVHSCNNVTDFKILSKKLGRIDFVILDIHLEDSAQSSGIDLIQELKQTHPETVILMSSNSDDARSILHSLRSGADEFLSKRATAENIVKKLLLVRQTALAKRGLLAGELSTKYHCAGDTMQKIAARVPQIINSAISCVYVEGESGTGKEVVADLFAAHTQPFLKINCGSIAPSILESELFGHKKGAFTGALNDKIGIIEAAHNGWLFLDEITSLSENAQVALLRVIENHEIIRMGEAHPRKINVRFIAASNIPVSQCVQNGKFRNDLWQRLCETEIILAALRDRRKEIPELVAYFCQHMQGGPYSIEQTALKVLCKLDWREGNIRELRNCLRAMTEHQYEKILSPLGIPARILTKTEQDMPSNASTTKSSIIIPTHDHNGMAFSYRQMCELLLKIYLEQYRSKLSIAQLAKKLRIARSTLQIKLKNLKMY